MADLPDSITIPAAGWEIKPGAVFTPAQESRIREIVDEMTRVTLVGAAPLNIDDLFGLENRAKRQSPRSLG